MYICSLFVGGPKTFLVEIYKVKRCTYGKKMLLIAAIWELGPVSFESFKNPAFLCWHRFLKYALPFNELIFFRCYLYERSKQRFVKWNFCVRINKWEVPYSIYKVRTRNFHRLKRRFIQSIIMLFWHVIRWWNGNFNSFQDLYEWKSCS